MVQGSFAGRGFGNFVDVWQTGVVPTFFNNSILVSLGVIALVYAWSMTRRVRIRQAADRRQGGVVLDAARWR